MEPQSQKLGNLKLVRGDRYANPLAHAEIELEREVRTRFAALRCVRTGRSFRDKTFYHIAAGHQRPSRARARLIKKMKERGLTFTQMLEAVFVPELQFARRLWGITEDTPKSA